MSSLQTVCGLVALGPHGGSGTLDRVAGGGRPPGGHTVEVV